MVYLFCLLFVMSCAIAQPVQGPYVVATVTREQCGGLSILNSEDGSAQVFYSFGDSAYHTTLDFSSGSVGQTSVLPGSDEGWNRRLCDAVFEEDGLWDVLLYDETNWENRTRIVTNRGDTLAFRQIDQGYNWASEWVSASVHVFPFLERRSGGGVFAGWTDHTDTWVGSFFCALAQAAVVRVTSESSDCFCDYGCPSIEFDSPFILLPVDSNSYYAIGPGIESQLCLYEEYLSVWSHSLSCEVYPIDLLRTRGRQLLVLSDARWGVHNRILGIDTSGSCESLFDAESDLPISASASHPDYGFAWLEQDGRGVYLWRADTSRQNSNVGILYWNDAWDITAYTLDIADDGTVTAAWCERINNEYTIRAAALDWDTHLPADDPRITPIPLSLNLAAYPNPFNSSLTITYELAKTTKVDLTVYNSLGQLVETLFAGEMNAGTHEQVWQPASGSGVYFVRLSDQSTQKIQKVLYLK